MLGKGSTEGDLAQNHPPIHHILLIHQTPQDQNQEKSIIKIDAGMMIEGEEIVRLID